MAKGPKIHDPIPPAPPAAREGYQLGGVTGKGWLPGQSGNPGGRAKGLGEYIRSQTADGQELVDHALHTLRNARSPWAARAAARRDLMDHGFGRPPQAVKVNLEGLQPMYVFPPGTDPVGAPDEHGHVAVVMPE
jgi:hypothetical protein